MTTIPTFHGLFDVKSHNCRTGMRRSPPSRMTNDYVPLFRWSYADERAGAQAANEEWPISGVRRERGPDSCRSLLGGAPQLISRRQRGKRHEHKAQSQREFLIHDSVKSRLIYRRPKSSITWAVHIGKETATVPKL